MEPRVVADRTAAAEHPFQPFGRLLFGNLKNFEEIGVDLLWSLEDIAAIDEQCRALVRDDGDAGRTGEARQPRQALFARRQKFILVLIAVGNEEAYELPLLQLLQQCLDPVAACRRSASFIEHLIHGKLCKPKARRRSIEQNACLAAS